jgi:CheY-like chemotaxis protein/ribosomal protein S14
VHNNIDPNTGSPSAGARSPLADNLDAGSAVTVASGTDGQAGTSKSPGRLDLEVRKLAHDLNNLLTVIHGNADLARLDIAADHPAWESLEEICQACGRSRELVRQILALCHQHGMSLASEPGSKVPAHATETDKSPTGTTQMLHNPARQRHILLIDDEQAFVSLAERLLSRCDFQVTGFTHPEQAIHTYRENPDQFDLIICDLNMPGLSGFDVVRELFRIRSGAVIILISGALRPDEIERAQKLGVREVMLKPDTFDDLVKCIQRLLG